MVNNINLLLWIQRLELLSILILLLSILILLLLIERKKRTAEKLKSNQLINVEKESRKEYLKKYYETHRDKINKQQCRRRKLKARK